jgi:hypothetical protein
LSLEGGLLAILFMLGALRARNDVAFVCTVRCKSLNTLIAAYII